MRYHVYPAAVISVTLMAGFSLAQDAPKAPDGWLAAAPREEIKPRFSFDPKGGPHGDGSLIISADKRDGLHGWWHKTFPIAGGKFYQFYAVRKVHDVEVPRRSAVVRIVWQDENGKPVTVDPPDETQ